MRGAWRWIRPRRARGWLWVALTGVIVGFDLRLRGRLSALHRLDDAGPVSTSTSTSAPVSASAGEEPFLVFTGPGVEVDDATIAAASRYARSNDLDVLDLVPEDAPIAQVLELASLVDPATYRTNALAPGHGALHALLVGADVAHRANLGPGRALGWDEIAGVTARAKLYAPRAADLVVSAGVRAVVPDPAARLDLLRARYGQLVPTALATPAVVHGLLGAGLVFSPGWGLAAVVAYVAEPFVGIAGSAVRPVDLTPGKAVQRLFRAPIDLVKVVRSGRAGGATPTPTPTPAPAPAGGAAVVDPIESRRAEYTELLAQGTDRFFEPRRDTCPLCASPSLSRHVDNPDFIQFKPGRFVLERCESCGHIFQNPRLSLAGLDFYYRDFYDGLGGGQVESVFAYGGKSYQGRVDLVRRHATPKAWLDVGTGYSHFCLLAQGLLPQTRFDGLDMGESIDEAERRGWITRAYRGLFPDLAGQLAGAYDVVSMHHYLEHTRDPLAELDAAHGVIEPGGHLLIEVPDPESRFARLVGSRWLPWFQPQHQHFLSVGNLGSALGARGFTVVEVERGPAHQPVDLAAAVWFLANQVATPGRVPWLDRPSPARRVRRAVTFVAAAPFLMAGLLADHGLAPLVQRRDGWSNTYRMLARRD